VVPGEQGNLFISGPEKKLEQSHDFPGELGALSEGQVSMTQDSEKRGIWEGCGC